MKMRKGFTLVELLIVIVIIGILAAAMLLSTGSATASAKASTIISDLRNLKAAAAMLVLESNDAFVSTATVDEILTAMAKFADNPEKYTAANSKFKVGKVVINSQQKAFGAFDIGASDADVKEKLKEKAKTVGLFGTANVSTPPTNFTTYYNGESVVWIAIY